MAVGDEEGDDPARDGDLGALIAEDEEGAQDGGFVDQGREEGFGSAEAGRGGVEGCDRRVEEGGRGGGVAFVVAEGDVGECQIEEGDGQRDKVECRLGPVVRDERRRHQRIDRRADAVGTVQAAQRRRWVGEVGAEDVVGRQVDGDVEADE